MDSMGFNYADMSEKELKLLQKIEEEINAEREDKILGVKVDNNKINN